MLVGPRLLARLLVVASLLAFAGCGSGMISGVTRSADFQKYRHKQAMWIWEPDVKVKVLQQPPRKLYAVVGTIEIRTSRPKTSAELRSELRANAELLEADAVIPPTPSQREEVVTRARLNPLQPFYVFDDGRTQILEAQAIRFASSFEPEPEPAP